MKTSRKTLLMAMVLLLSTGAFSQKIHYGIKAGTNFAVQSELADYFQNDQIRVGLSAGVFGNYAFTDKMQLQAEINYDQKGAKSDEVTAKYDYLSVPVLFKYSLGKSDHTALNFNVNLGPYAAFLLNSELEMDENTTDMADATENFEAGAILGFGMKYPVGNDHLLMDLRLGLGLTNFDKADIEPNNKYIGLTLGYEF